MKKNLELLSTRMMEIAESRINGTTELLISSITEPVFIDRNCTDQETIFKLARNIKEYGLINPVVVRKKGKDKYERIAGYRRIEAFKMLKLDKITAVVLDNVDDKMAMMIMLSENMQREDLNPYDEVNSLLHLISITLNIAEDELKSILYRIDNHNTGKLKVFTFDEQEIKKQIEEILDKVVKYKFPGFIKKLAVLKLNPILVDAMKKNHLAFTHALLLNKLKKEDDLKGLLKETLENNTPYKELAEKVKILNGDGQLGEPNPCADVIKKLHHFYKIPEGKRAKILVKIEEIKTLLAG